ncbi:MAG: glycosyltransferase family 4 protein, partial [Candidatus Eisenbacteria bacterium]|nr:glycosyltransferase family 4 protein [Candidatus Eisenbacteria bacterium]
TGSALASRAREGGHPVIELPMRGDADVRSVLGLAGWMRRRRVEVLNVNVQRAVRIGCAAARLVGVKAVVERRGLDLPIRDRLVNRAVYGRCLTHVVANCKSIERGVLSSGLVDRDRLSVIPNGIDPDRVPRGGGELVRRELSVEERAPLVAVIGRLVPDKGHDVAIEAFAGVLQSLPSARMIIAGGGSLEQKLRSEALRLSPAGAVIVAGHREDVPAILDAADVVLVTSSREGMPHVILEAMVSGTPVIATRTAGIPEMIEDGEDGLLIPVGSAEAARTAMTRLLTDRDLASRLAGGAAKRARSEFSLTVMVDRFEELFGRLASNPAHSGLSGPCAGR